MREASKTAKCPDCGSKYLIQTGYCVSCKKKVGKKDKKKEDSLTIEITQDTPIGNTILEKGDKIKILDENFDIRKLSPISTGISNLALYGPMSPYDLAQDIGFAVDMGVEDLLVDNTIREEILMGVCEYLEKASNML